MKSFYILVWLRWRLLINELESGYFSLSRIFHLLFIGMYFIFCFGIGFIFSVLINLSSKHGGSTQWIYNANIFFVWILLILLFYKIISPGQFFRNIDLNRLRFYPITSIFLFLFDFLFGFIDRWYIAIFFIIMGFITGLGLRIDIIIDLPALTFIVFTIIMSFHFLFTTIEEIVLSLLSFSKIIRFCILALITIGLVIIYFKGRFLLETPFYIVQNYSPIGYLNNALSGLFIENKPWVVNYYFWKSFLFASTLFIFLIVTHVIRITFIPEVLGSDIIRKNKWRLTLENILFFIPLSMKTFVVKDLRYIVRSRRTQLSILLELIFIFFIYYKYGINADNINNHYIIIYFILFFPLMLWETYMSNYFGMEKSAFTLYLFCPISIERLITAKNISFFILQTPFIILEYMAFIIIMPLSLMPLLIISQISVFCFFAIMGNINSVTSPYPVDRNTQLFKTRSSGFSFQGMVGLICFIVLPIIIGLVIWKWNSTYSAYWILITIAVISSIIYYSIKSYTSKLFKERSELHYKIMRSI
jgi:hypothetical protein